LIVRLPRAPVAHMPARPSCGPEAGQEHASGPCPRNAESGPGCTSLPHRRSSPVITDMTEQWDVDTVADTNLRGAAMAKDTVEDAPATADAGAVAIRVSRERVVPLRLPPQPLSRCARLPPPPVPPVGSQERRGRLQLDPPRRLRAGSGALLCCQRWLIGAKRRDRGRPQRSPAAPPCPETAGDGQVS
jgi:hypothetical protein